jgi:hypothetical protein
MTLPDMQRRVLRRRLKVERVVLNALENDSSAQARRQRTERINRRR